MTLKSHVLALGLLLVVPLAAQALDSDGDGIDDSIDNCSQRANAGQRDSDGDGLGNHCDPDLNNDNRVDQTDVDLFKALFGSVAADADLNGDGIVSSIDIRFFQAYLGGAPGPGASDGSLNAAMAARFLSQSTFGPTQNAIAELQDLGSFSAWIDAQYALAPSLLLPGTKNIYQRYRAHCVTTPSPYECTPSLAEILTLGQDGVMDTWHTHYRHVWWHNVIDGADQLRQRVAFALSEILVVSSVPDTLGESGLGMADFYDTLSRNAFGNYRELLEDVTLHPVMGIYLSMVQNEKADPERNIRPDENFARELMQLFTIGVDQLNLDGSPVLDADGEPIPTYGQVDVQAFARVFTGWSYANVAWDAWYGMGDRTTPMQPFEEYHDTEQKVLLNGTVLPAGQNARQDLEAALDNLFQHPNVGPFIGRSLIQRLITSNPSPEYVSRVAAVFNNNGAGVRGDLGAVVRAILLDPEARNAPGVTFGKLREPLLRISHLFRAFKANRIAGGDWDVPPDVSVYNSPGVWSGLHYFQFDAGQNILASPSVFNFFRPDYAPVGPVRDQGLVAPEFQIATENNVMAMVNTINYHVQDSDADWNVYWSRLDLSAEAALLPNLNNPDPLLEHLNLLLTSGGMSDGLRQILRDHLGNDVFSNTDEGRMAAIKDAISLIVSSPEYLIQK